MGALAAVVSVLVGLPPFAAAPAPGALPPGVGVHPLDPALGIVQVDLPRAGLAASLQRLRRAPGTRYAGVEVTGNLAAGCVLSPAQSELGPSWWRSVVRVPAGASAAGFTVGVVDSGADVERLGSHQVPITGRDFTSS